MGGIGKTAFALKVAESHKTDFPDAQIQLDLKGLSEDPLTAIEVMNYVLRSFSRDFKIPETEAELSAIYRSKLRGLKSIIFLDNAPNGKIVADLIPPQDSLLIFTSRQYFKLPGMLDIHLNTLSPDDSVDLLRLIAPRIGSQADQIARLCGYLPLALRLAGSALAGWVDLDPGEYVDWLSQARKRLEVIDSSLGMSQDSFGIEATFMLSYDLLDVEKRRFWSLLAVFPNSFDRAAVSSIWGIGMHATSRMVNDLVVKYLVEWAPASQRYNLHDLARIFADNQLSETERASGQERMARHYLEVIRRAEEMFTRGGEDLKSSLRLIDLEWPNIIAALEWAKADSELEVGLALGNEYLKYGSRLLNLRIAPGDRIHWYEFGLKCAQKLNKPADQASHLKNLGIACFELGDLQACIKYSDSALEVFRSIGERKNAGKVLGILGLAYNARGEIYRAIEYFQQHLELAREIGDRSGEGSALGNIGMAYKNLGKPGEAITYHEESLAILREVGNRPAEGATLNDMGNAYLELKNFAQAIDLYKQALDIFREIGDRRNESNALGNLGLVYTELGDHIRGIQSYVQALAIDRELGNRLGEEITLCNLADLYSKEGDPERTVELCQQALAIAREIGDRYGEADAQAKLGVAFHLLDKREQAVIYTENAISILEDLGIEDSLVHEIKTRLENWR
jgi:tetratricopeptide (TPR) repeat protein